jgi:hypothetical protein
MSNVINSTGDDNAANASAAVPASSGEPFVLQYIAQHGLDLRIVINYMVEVSFEPS